MRAGVILAAAGMGQRMNTRLPKAFIKLDKYPLFIYSIKLFEEIKSIESVVLVVSKGYLKKCNDIIKKYKFKKVVDVIQGGITRQQSIYNGIKYYETNNILDNNDIVLAHDAARPLVKKKLVEELILCAKEFNAAIPAVPATDTVKEMNSKEFINRTIDRNSLWFAQTPQVFKFEILKKAYYNVIDEAVSITDDAMACEIMGIKPKIVHGDFGNIKITMPEDILIAEAFLKKG